MPKIVISKRMRVKLKERFPGLTPWYISNALAFKINGNLAQRIRYIALAHLGGKIY